MSEGAYDRLSRPCCRRQMPPLVQPTLTMAATPPTQVVMWDGGGMKSSGGILPIRVARTCGAEARAAAPTSVTRRVGGSGDSQS